MSPVSSINQHSRLKVIDIYSLDSFVTPYVFAQVEPSTAVLCACLITYRPLFKDLNLKFLKTLMPTSRRGSSKNKAAINLGISSSSPDDSWNASYGDVEKFHPSLERLNKKAASGNVHVVNLGLMPSRLTDHRTSRDGELPPPQTSRAADSIV